MTRTVQSARAATIEAAIRRVEQHIDDVQNGRVDLRLLDMSPREYLKQEYDRLQTLKKQRLALPVG